MRKLKTIFPQTRTVFVVRMPDGSFWGKYLYRAIAQQVVDREAKRALTITEQIEEI